MKKVNQFFLGLTATFLLAILVTPMSAQTRTSSQTGILPTSVETSVTRIQPTAPTASLATVTAAIDVQISAYEKALNAENAAAVAATVDASIVISEPDGSSRTLPEADFLALLKEAFKAAGKEVIDIYGYNVQLIGADGARVVGDYSVSVLDENGEVTDMVRAGNFIFIFRKTAEGWVIREMTDFPN